MNLYILHRILGFVFLFVLLFPHPVHVLAQSEPPVQQVSFPEARISPPDLDGFPLISVYLAVQNNDGEFLQSFSRQNFIVIEDDVALSVMEADKLRPGVQVVTAITPGNPFARRNSQAISRYDILLDELKIWFNSRGGTTIDDYSLIVDDGPQIFHSPDSLELGNILETINREVRDILPNLDIVFQAVEVAADSTPRSGMGRAVFWITPPLEQEYAQSLENLAARAIEQNVNIFVWSIGPEDASTQQANQRLENLAQRTGGSIFVSTGDEDFPSPEQFLDPLRNVYSLLYMSEIRTSGVHTIRVEILDQGQVITSQTQTFELNISLPVPAFIKPPTSINREIVPSDEYSPQEPTVYEPDSQEVEILVDFSDGLRRPLVRSALLVDNVLVEEHTEPPFERFTWDLRGYTQDGTHTLKAEVTDQFGLSGSSVEAVVAVTIEQPVSNWSRLLSSNLLIIVILTVLIAGSILLLGLVWAGKIRPTQIERLKKHKPRQKSSDLQAPKVIPEPPSRPSWVQRFHLPHRRVNRAYAYLTPYTEDHPKNSTGNTMNSNRLKTQSIPQTYSINLSEVTIGSDPNQVTLLVDDPSIEPLHSRLVRQVDKSFIIFDEDTEAGTWVNYTQVSPEGQRLENGDIIHIGRRGFHFSLRQAIDRDLLQ